MNPGFISFDFANNMQATFILDDATYAAVKDNLRGAEGKAVALTGPVTVGFGSSANKLIGVIMKVETDKMATIRTAHYAEGVYLGMTPPSVGDVVKVDGVGGLVSASTQTNYGPILIRIDDDGTGVIKF